MKGEGETPPHLPSPAHAGEGFFRFHSLASHTRTDTHAKRKPGDQPNRSAPNPSRPVDKFFTTGIPCTHVHPCPIPAITHVRKNGKADDQYNLHARTCQVKLCKKTHPIGHARPMDPVTRIPHLVKPDCNLFLPNTFIRARQAGVTDRDIL